MLTDTEYMSIALRGARAALAAGNPGVAAVIVRDGEIVGAAGNRAAETGNPTRHAELEALDRVCEQHGAEALLGSTCYTTMEPCPMCVSALIQAGVSRIVLGGRHDDVFPGRFGRYRVEEAIAASGQPVTLRTDVLRHECARIRAAAPKLAQDNASMLSRRFDDASAWTNATLRRAEWAFTFDDACISELLEAGRTLDDNPIQVVSLGPDDAALPNCRRVMNRVRHALTFGPRFAVVDRLPLDALSEDAAYKLYWILMSNIARPVAQTHCGSLTFSVRDTGRLMTPGSGVRPAVTNVEQLFHNDNAFNGAPPDIVTLLCVRPAVRGGISRIVSFASIHNRLAQRYPDSLTRLYRPFEFDRQREHAPGDTPHLEQPIFCYDGTLKVRLTPALVHAGYAVKGEPIDPAGAVALERLVATTNEPDLCVEMMLERGQIQLVNNHETGHARTAFDDTGAIYPRHLERLWLRRGGRRTYAG